MSAGDDYLTLSPAFSHVCFNRRHGSILVKLGNGEIYISDPALAGEVVSHLTVALREIADFNRKQQEGWKA